MSRLEHTRRRIMRLGAAMGAAAMLPGARSASATATGTHTMHTRRIPSSGEMLPVIGFGTWQTFDIDQARADLDQRKEVLEVLFKAGGRVIDSSPMYGRAEAVVGQLLAEMGVRDKAFLATKVWTEGEKAGIAQMDSSAAKLRSQTIDLMQVHNLVDWRTHLKTLRAWKEQGRFRYIGITHYTIASLDEIAGIIAQERIDFVQAGYSLNVRTAEKRLLPLCAEKGVAFIANQPFDSGAMFGKVKGRPLPAWATEIGCASMGQIFLKYLVSHAAVTCAIPGTARAEHARDNVAAGIGVLPDESHRKRIAAWWDGV